MRPPSVARARRMSAARALRPPTERALQQLAEQTQLVARARARVQPASVERLAAVPQRPLP